jgi:hypothetical protein
VAVALMAFAMWPLIHRVLVARYDLSPWRFFGWAMYCQPKIPPVVDAYVDVDGVRLPLQQVLKEPREVSRARLQFIQRRETWGTLVRPDELSRRILEAVPKANMTEIVVRHLELDPSTAHLRAREYGYRYPLYRSDL